MGRKTSPAPDRLSPLEEKIDSGDIVGALKRTPALLRRIVAGAPASWFAARAPKGSWSRPDVLSHLLDTETVMTFRIRKILCEKDPNVSFFDQDRWVDGLRAYRETDPVKTVSRFAALRAQNASLLAALSGDQMARTGVHPETGRLTLEDLAVRMARHDLNHLRQLIAG